MKTVYIGVGCVLLGIVLLLAMEFGTFNTKDEATVLLPNGYTVDEYTIAEVTDVSCVRHDECETPAEYLIRSNCPYTSLCLEQTCTVVCPEFEK